MPWGAQSYEELREICRSETTRKTLTFAERRDRSRKAVAPRRPGDAEPGGHFCASRELRAITNIEALLRNIDLENSECAADVLASCGPRSAGRRTEFDRVCRLYGVHGRNGVPELGRSSVAGGSSVPGGLLDASKRDAVLVVAKSPYARRSVEGVRLASQGGARIVAITDGVQSPVMRLADHSFVVRDGEPELLSLARGHDPVA